MSEQVPVAYSSRPSSSSLTRTEVKPVECIKFCEDAFKIHEALCDITEQTLGKLLSSDTYLHNIAGDISHEEVLAQVNIHFIVIRKNIVLRLWPSLCADARP